ncbi:MAG: MFS transporter [Thermomicrobiales bacterium]
MTGPDQDGHERAFRVLRHHDFRLFWVAELVSVLGTQVQRVAIIWQVYQLTESPFQLGLLGLFRFLPVLVFGLAGGVIADQRDRRQTLLITQVVLLLTSGVLVTTTTAGMISMPIIYGVTFFSAMVSSVAQPTRQALVPNLVPVTSLTGAMTMNILAYQVAAVSGPALGGLIIAWSGVGAAYLIDVISFGAVIIAVLLLKTHGDRQPLKITGFAAAKEGLRFLRNSPVLLGLMSLDFLATFFGASTVLMPVFAADLLDVGAQGLGILLTAPAVGAVAGSLVMSVIRTPGRPGRGVLVAVAVYGACVAGFGLSQSLWAALLFLAGSGAADAVSMALRHTVRNLVTPDALRGRIAAAHSTFAMGGPQLGEFEAGLVAALAGARVSVTAGGVATMVVALFMFRLVPGLARTVVTVGSGGTVANRPTADGKVATDTSPSD